MMEMFYICIFWYVSQELLGIKKDYYDGGAEILFNFNKFTLKQSHVTTDCYTG